MATNARRNPQPLTTRERASRLNDKFVANAWLELDDWSRLRPVSDDLEPDREGVPPRRYVVPPSEARPPVARTQYAFGGVHTRPA